MEKGEKKLLIPVNMLPWVLIKKFFFHSSYWYGITTTDPSSFISALEIYLRAQKDQIDLTFGRGRKKAPYHLAVILTFQTSFSFLPLL